ncbi:MAG: VanW family protein [Patescibacteria group bacterium]
MKKLLAKLRPKKKKKIKSFLPFFLIFALFLLLEAGYFVLQNRLADRLPFGIKIADAEYSLVPARTAIAELETRAKNFALQPIEFEVGGETAQIAPAEFDLNFAVAQGVGLLRGEVLHLGSVALPVQLNEKRLRRILLSHFPELEYGATQAKVYLNEKGELQILPEKTGRETDFAALATQIKENTGEFRNPKIVIESHAIEPTILAKDLEPFRAELVKIIAKPLVLQKTAYERFEINLADRIAWFGFEDGKVILKKELVQRFVEQELNPLLTELPHDVVISKDASGQIVFEGVAKNGQTVDGDALFEKISDALRKDDRLIDLPFQILPAPIKIADELKDLGIHELVGESVTNYSGSPANRQFNIKVAAAKLNGKIIEPDAEFSFIKTLGPITTATGYRQELIIKDGDIIPEVGGGVCQVSTTVFRTALDTGLPITAQRPHSFKVVYYDPPGLDATIYPGSADLKFVNDTGAPILLQTAVEGTTLRVNFFGTNDGRAVKLAGPFYPNGDPVTNLKLAGLRMFWTREVDKKDGEAISETYKASYKIMPKH